MLVEFFIVFNGFMFTFLRFEQHLLAQVCWSMASSPALALIRQSALATEMDCLEKEENKAFVLKNIRGLSFRGLSFRLLEILHFSNF